MFYVFGNRMADVDKVFFLIVVIVIALCVGIYYLIPVLNKKQYEQQRENLKKREEVFNANLRAKDESKINKDSGKNLHE